MLKKSCPLPAAAEGPLMLAGWVSEQRPPPLAARVTPTTGNELCQKPQALALTGQ